MRDGAVQYWFFGCDRPHYCGNSDRHFSKRFQSRALFENGVVVELVRQAVTVEGYRDWARLRWPEDLAILHQNTAFADLLARNGRSAAADTPEFGRGR